MSNVVLVAMTAFVATGCGTTGWIRFEAIDDGYPAEERGPTAASAVETIECQDYRSGEQSFPYPAFPKRLLYVTTCTKDGAGIPWRVLGVFHAAAIALDKWPKYSREVVEKARARGCPLLLVRRSPPTSSQEAQAIGALCVDPAQPSGVRGPMRLAALSQEPLEIMSDDEPDPPPR